MHELDDKKLKKRAVVNIDIANDSVASADYKADQDPKTFKSEKTGRGPLTGDWKVSIRAGRITLVGQDRGIFRQQPNGLLYISSLQIPSLQSSVTPVMTAYKLVTIQFKWFGLQDRVENFIHSTEKRIFTNFHRQVGQ